MLMYTILLTSNKTKTYNKTTFGEKEHEYRLYMYKNFHKLKSGILP